MQRSNMYAGFISAFCSSIKGFTLIELLVVVIIIAVLAAVAMPMYKRAVLKSRFTTVMPMAKAVADAQEVYYLGNGQYALDKAELDITPVEANNTAVVLSPTDGYDYVLAQRSDVPEVHYIMYQKHSENYPGEIHCEALDENALANWVCSAGMHAVKDLGETITAGYNTYVLEGTGNGLTPAQVEAAKNCAAAYTAGATTCNVTNNPSTNGKTKQVCYSIKEADDHCVTTELNAEGKEIKRTICTDSQCVEHIYDENGNEILQGLCSGSSISSDKKSCDRYGSMYAFEYDTAGQHRTGAKECMDISGKSCDTFFDSKTFYGYGKNSAALTRCYDNSKSECYDRYEYTYDAEGNVTQRLSCLDSNICSGGSCCRRYDYHYTYNNEYDGAGNLTAVVQCNDDSYSCSRTEYEFLDANRRLSKRCFGDSSDDLGTCANGYGNITEDWYDESGNQIYSRSCKKYNGAKTECEEWNDFRYDYSDDIL